MSHKILQKLRDVQLLVMDVDGVLTDGTFLIDKDGNESKNFSARDGIGIKILNLLDIKTAIISGRSSIATIERAKDLNIDDVSVGVKNKTFAMQNLLKKYEFTKEQICFIGDDFEDIPAFKLAGVSVLVGDSPIVDVYEVDLVTQTPGGKGAVRELADLIVKAKGKSADVLQHFLDKANVSARNQ